MRFMTAFNFVPCPQLLHDDKEIVETAGYVPRQKTIENLLLCGQRLVEFRKEDFDGKTVEEALENAPISRVNNLDLGESLNLLSKLSDEARESKANAGGGVSVQVGNNESEVDKTSDSSKEG